MSQIPHISCIFPKIDTEKVAQCLELEEIKTFAAIAQLRATIAGKMSGNTDYWKEVDGKLEEAQDVLLDVLHESEAAVDFSNLAIDAATVIVAGGAHL